jgi:cyclic pyranopterin phosphate synthase
MDKRQAANSIPSTDGHGRTIDYLRLSITDRCNLRCGYCIQPDRSFDKHGDLLTIEEVARLAQLFVQLGIDRIRLTGGEPLVRRGVATMLTKLGAIDGLRELTLTTNGVLLDKYLDDIAAAGIRRINVSLDSVDPLRFQRITGFDQLAKIQRNIDSALAAGIGVRLNAVVLPDLDASEISGLVDYAKQIGCNLVFIEEMPFTRHVDVTQSRIGTVRNIVADNYPVTPTAYRSNGPANYVQLTGASTRVGFIEPLSQCFCEECNRVRLTATGKLFACLDADRGFDLRGLLRSEMDNQAIAETVRAAIHAKPLQHAFLQRPGATRVHGMHQIGG